MKSSRRTMLVGIAAATLSLGVISPGVAGTSTTYHGYYDGVTVYAPYTEAGHGACVTTQKAVRGTWNVRISPDRDTATMSTNLFYDGEHHLAYGGAALDRFEVLTPGADQFKIQGNVVGTDITVTLTLTQDGVLSYVVAPYPPELFGQDCASLTLTGYEGRPAVE